MLARTDGVLQATTNADGTACLVVGGRATIWPQGFGLKGDPLSVYDGSGKLVAVVGQKVALGGGLAGNSAPVLGCPGSSEAWIVGSVISE